MQARDTTVTKVSSAFSPKGKMGQTYLASGKNVAMRLWREEPTDAKTPSTRDYETVGFVIEGRARLDIEGQLIVLEAGDSWVVPRGARHSYEILEHFVATGPASVRALAARMGRSPHALHYHVRLMEGAGLLRRTGTVKSGPRDEALYDVVAEQYALDAPPAGRRGDAPEARTIRAVLRRAEREFAEALVSGRARSHRDAHFAGRLRARLSAKARRDVGRHLAAIQRIFAQELRREHPPGSAPETCSFTAVYLQEPRGE